MAEEKEGGDHGMSSAREVELIVRANEPVIRVDGVKK